MITYSRIIDTHAEQQHCDGVLRPAHLVRFVHACQAIQQALDGPQHRIHERLLAAEHARHVHAHRLRDRQQQNQIQTNLKPSVRRHVQNLSGHKSAASRYTSSNAEIPRSKMLPSMFAAPYFNRSQAHTYTIAKTKNPTVQMKNAISRIESP